MKRKKLTNKTRVAMKHLFSVGVFISLSSCLNCFLTVEAQEILYEKEQVLLDNISAKNKGYQLVNISSHKKPNSLTFSYNTFDRTPVKLKKNSYVANKIETIENVNKNEDSLNLAIKKVEQARIQITQGQVKEAIAILEEAIATAKQNNAKVLEASAQKNLGDAYRLFGEYERAAAAYQISLQSIENAEPKTEIFNGLWDVFAKRSQRHQMSAKSAELERNLPEVSRYEQLARRDRDLAIQYARQALETSEGGKYLATVRAWINWQNLTQRKGTSDRTPSVYETVKSGRVNLSTPKQTSLPEVIAILDQLPDSRSKIYLAIKLAEVEPEKTVEILTQAIETGEKLNDSRALSFAYGAIGNHYEKQSSLQQALESTQKAQLAAEKAISFDSLYRWQWQAGRLYQAMGNRQASLNSYRGAIASLQNIRTNLIAASKQQQLDVREEYEPVYREMLNLLLENEDRDRIEEALKIADLIQISDLQSFFGDDCLEVQGNVESQKFLKRNNAALIRAIVLKDRTYIVLELPDGSLKRYPVNLSKQELETQILNWRFYLEKLSQTRYIVGSKSLYNLLIRPLEKDLQQASVSRLVFVNDGILRNVPMAALYDGKNYLIKKYAISYSLGLNFKIDPPKKKGKTLAFGLTVGTNNFPPLPYVKEELSRVQKLVDSEEFLDRAFTKDNLRQKIEEGFSVVHIATHGKFEGEAENAFIQAFDNKISLSELEEILSESSTPIDLLILSACETAKGNDLAVLGLAGMSVRAGVGTTLGSLWSVNDAENAKLIADFYTFLQQKPIDRADALRQAQLKQIDRPESHPGIWASSIILE
jgi:CHAT domain-containing protein